MKEAFPGAEIVQDRVDNYPIRVIVSAEVNGQKMEVWSGRQQSLFSKYTSERKQAMAAIVQNLEDLKEDFDL